MGLSRHLSTTPSEGMGPSKPLQTTPSEGMGLSRHLSTTPSEGMEPSRAWGLPGLFKQPLPRAFQASFSLGGTCDQIIKMFPKRTLYDTIPRVKKH